MTKFLLATSDDVWPARVRHAFGENLNGDLRVMNAQSHADPDDVMRELHDTDSPVLVVGPGVESAAALALARAVDERRPDVSVILVAQSSPVLLQEAVRAGVRDVVDPTSEDGLVRGSLELALETALRRRAALRAAQEEDNASKVITVLSPKGGSGKTAMATNLAVGLARSAPHDVVVVDLDVQFGDVSNALRLSPERTTADVARNADSLDATTVKAFLTPHPAGMFVLCAPESPADADAVTPEVIASTIDLLSGMFSYVVVDTGAGMDDAALTATEHSTDLVLVCTTDVASARALQKGVATLDMLGVTEARRHFVLNRADARVGITIQDIETTVGLDVAVAIPSARAIPTSMNQGSPVLESDPRSSMAKGLTQLVRRFTSADEGRRSQPLVPSGARLRLGRGGQ
jgi:pilus assembly protein CpaE